MPKLDALVEVIYLSRGNFMALVEQKIGNRLRAIFSDRPGQIWPVSIGAALLQCDLSA